MLERLRRPAVALAAASALLALVGAVTVALAAPLLDPALNRPGDNPRAVSDLAAEGEAIYVREGCQSCHTQLVRPGDVPADAQLGPATNPGDAYYQVPALYGSVRIGPDLSCAADRFPEEELDQAVTSFLQDPGSRGGSHMPAYSQLGEEGLQALTAYLLTRTCGLERPAASPPPGEGGEEQPPSDPLAECEGAPAPEGDPVELTISANNVAFDTDRLEGARHCEPFTIVFDNQEPVPHNVAIYVDETQSVEIFREEPFSGPETVTYEIPALPAGEYFFLCEVHPTMSGTLVVTGGQDE